MVNEREEWNPLHSLSEGARTKFQEARVRVGANVSHISSSPFFLICTPRLDIPPNAGLSEFLPCRVYRLASSSLAEITLDKM